jgi:hypothetical protein
MSNGFVLRKDLRIGKLNGRVRPGILNEREALDAGGIGVKLLHPVLYFATGSSTTTGIGRRVIC